MFGRPVYPALNGVSFRFMFNPEFGLLDASLGEMIPCVSSSAERPACPDSIDDLDDLDIERVPIQFNAITRSFRIGTAVVRDDFR